MRIRFLRIYLAMANCRYRSIYQLDPPDASIATDPRLAMEDLEA